MIVDKDHCEVCGKRITVMINRGSGICGEICRKVKHHDRYERNQALIAKAAKKAAELT